MENEVTVEDVIEWAAQLEKENIKERKYKVYRYCPHLNKAISILETLSECGQCDSEILKNYFNNNKK